MGIRGDLRDFFPHQVQNLKRAASPGSRYFAREKLLSSEADHNVLAPRVVSDIVGIKVERHRLQKLKCAAVKDFYRAVPAAGNEKAIALGIEIRPLRFVQTGNGVDLPTTLQIDHFERVIVKRSRKEALALHVDAEMIHAPFNVGQSYACL